MQTLDEYTPPIELNILFKGFFLFSHSTVYSTVALERPVVAQ